jgi:hypothetical protein
LSSQRRRRRRRRRREGKKLLWRQATTEENDELVASLLHTRQRKKTPPSSARYPAGSDFFFFVNNAHALSIRLFVCLFYGNIPKGNFPLPTKRIREVSVCVCVVLLNDWIPFVNCWIAEFEFPAYFPYTSGMDNKDKIK